MKKTYEAPKAKRMEFDYSETVVASTGQKCRWETRNGEWETSSCNTLDWKEKTDYIAGS